MPQNQSRKIIPLFAVPAVLAYRSDLFGHYVRSTIYPAQQAIRFLVINHLLRLRIEIQTPSQTIRSIRQVHEST